MDPIRHAAPIGPTGPPGLQVTYAPLCDATALLDTSGPVWSLHLDIDSPAEDRCWAMLELLEVLAHAGSTAGTATRVPRSHPTPRSLPRTPR
jgi:hypothetical protein